MTLSTSRSPTHVAAMIRERRPNFQPHLGIVLGSGLGGFAQILENTTFIPYGQLPGFPETSVRGHEGQMVLGQLYGMDIVCLQGRAHRYEGDHADEAVKMYVRTLQQLGCEYFVAISACGSLRSDIAPGQLMVVEDHINFQGTNPLMGPNQDEFGPRFFPVDHTYDVEARRLLQKAAARIHLPLAQGVYIAVSGPNYETAAEIRAFQRLGADAVGMSTVPEVLVATHCGMKVMVIAVMTNYATGIATESHSHDAVVSTARDAGEHVNRLMREFIALKQGQCETC